MTATLAARQDIPPTAVDIDRLAVQFLDLSRKQTKPTKSLPRWMSRTKKMKEELICLVEEFGSAHAEKSKLLHGITHEILATFGVSTSIDAAAVERFAQALRIAKQTKMLNRIFEQTIRYTLRPDAGSIIRAVTLPKAQLALFAQCTVSKPRTPTLKVRRIVSE